MGVDRQIFSRSPYGCCKRQNHGPWIVQMRLLLATLLSLATFAFVVMNHGSEHGVTTALLADGYTTHIGSRVPPAEAECMQVDEISSLEGKRLGVYACPAKLAG